MSNKRVPGNPRHAWPSYQLNIHNPARNHDPASAAQYDLSDDSYEKALDALLDDPDFLSTVEDEVGALWIAPLALANHMVLYKAYGNQLDEFGEK
eukprot:1157827-Pelagomonas_calceolata.AAC.1